MINWNLVDAGVIAWAMVNGAICAAIVGLSVYLIRHFRRSKVARKQAAVRRAIAAYDKRNHKRGAVAHLVGGVHSAD